MSTATFDARNLVRERLQELNVSAATFSVLAGTTDSTFSDFVRGKRSLGHAREQAMLKLLDRLLAYQDALRPFTLPFNDLVTTRRLLKHFEDAGITPEMVRESVVALVGSSGQSTTGQSTNQ